MTKTLYDPSFEHDACGVGMIADLTGTPSFGTISDALTILENLEHRGAVGADVDSGDGAGILVQLPDAFLRAVLDISLPSPGEYGVAQWMLSREVGLEAQQSAIETVFESLGLSTLTWRLVPVDSSILGSTSKASEPWMYQQVVAPISPSDNLEGLLYCARKLVEHEHPAYASSCSSKILIYKGMLSSPQLRLYYEDLRDERLQSAIAVVHSRFSTNVLPRWDL
ncbi:MAG: hypothetical protein B7X07_07070, partial [Actinobacteria bacterium 21-64-8]